MTSEFSARAALDVTVSEKSLKDARQQVEDGISGRSVRASLTPAVSDGGRNSGGRGSVLDTLKSTNEILVSIRDTLEDSAFERSGGGGGTGAKAAALLATGASATAFGAGTALAAIGGGVGLAGTALDQPLKDSVNNATGGFFDDSENFQRESLVSQLTGDPLTGGITQSIGEALGRKAGRALQQAATESASALREDINRGFSTASTSVRETLNSVQFETPSWVQSLLNFRLETPSWLSRLTGFELSEPSWLSELRRLLGTSNNSSTNGSGPRGGTGRASDVPPTRIPGQTGMDVSVSVDGSGLQREFKQAIIRGLRSRDVEQFIADTVRDQVVNAR